MKLNRFKVDLKMAENHMTIKDLANNYGVTRTRMQSILRQQEVTPICAGRMASALKCDVAEIIEIEK